jgi:ubiquinone/menaquinone biosynthesis C-methylase UbiE
VSSVIESMIDGHIAQPGAIRPCVSVEQGYQRWAATYDETPNPILALEQRCLLPLLPRIAGKRVLDLACGTGRWLEKLSSLAPALGIGIDSSAAMLAVAREKPTIARRLTRADCLQLPFRTAVFDLAVCSFALEHMENLGELATEWSRVLQQSSDLYISELHPSAYAAGWRTGFRDLRGAMEIEAISRSTNEIVTAFSGTGFELSQMLECFVGEPERQLFASAGKERFFDSARLVPAVLILHFRRSSPVEEN